MFSVDGRRRNKDKKFQGLELFCGFEKFLRGDNIVLEIFFKRSRSGNSRLSGEAVVDAAMLGQVLGGNMEPKPVPREVLEELRKSTAIEQAILFRAVVKANHADMDVGTV